MHPKISAPWIAYDQKLSKSQDYYFLRREGIRMVQELAGKIWTDYNDHDPGVTILEQCCYALTDLAYRTGIDIEKLLFAQGDVEDVAVSNSLYLPEEVLLASNVTLLDHKRLFLDQLPGIANVWFRAVAPSEGKGLYDIVVLPLADQSNLEQVEQKVRRFYTAHRNICEDVSQVVVLKPEPIEISAILDLYEETPVEDALAEIYYQLDDYFNHKITYTSFEKLQQDGWDLLKIFEMPSFDKNKGFLNSLCLEEYKSCYSMSKIQNLFSGVKGIRSVRNIVVRKNGIQITSEQIDIQEGCFAALSTVWDQASITVLKNNLKVDYKIDQVKALYKHRISEDAKFYVYNDIHRRSAGGSKMDLLSDYASIQNTFPTVYGIGSYGLPSEASTDRVQYARQLQGFILFFDQILINHLANLVNIPQLFSYDPTQATTKVAFPSMVPNVEDLVQGALKDMLHGLMDDDFPQRKNRLLDHLLARFGERFVDPSQHNLHNVYGLDAVAEILPTMVALKSSLLRQIKVLQQHKNKASDYALPYWNGKALFGNLTHLMAPAEPNCAVFKKKVFLYLNLPEENLGNGSLLPDYTALSIKEVDTAQNHAATPNSASKVTFVLPQSATVLDRLVHYGGYKGYYEIANKPNAYGLYALTFKYMEAPSPVYLGAYVSKDDALVAMNKLTQKFKAISRRSEGFHVLEHILLRPTFKESYMLLIEVAPNILLLSVHKDTYEEQKALLFDVFIYGSVAHNYEVRQQNTGASVKYYVSLKDDKGNDLMRLKTSPHLSTRLIAQSFIEEKLVPFVKSMSMEKFAIPSSVHIKDMRATENSDKQLGGNDAPDFFHGSLSLVLPNWLPRFNEPDFRALLRVALIQNLPAHIQANTVWLGKTEMANFERIYQKWMQLKAEIVGLRYHGEATSTAQRALYRKERNHWVAKTRLMDAYALHIVTRFLKPATHAQQQT